MEVNVTNITTSVEVEAGYDLFEVVIFEGSEENARQYAIEAALSASDALDYANQAEADKVQTGLDRIATGADSFQTGLDVIEATEQATIATEAALLAVESSNSTLIQDLGSISGTVLIDLTLGTLIKATLTGAVTLLFTGLPSTTSEKGFTLRFSGLQMIVFPIGTLFANGDAPTPAGTLYDIPCSISSAGVVIVYGSINNIQI